MKVVLGLLVLLISIVYSSFAASMIASSFVSGLLFMYRLNKKGLLKRTNYTPYLISIAFWGLTFYLTGLFFVKVTSLQYFWFLGNVIGILASFKVFDPGNLENNRIEFFNANKSLLQDDFIEIVESYIEDGEEEQLTQENNPTKSKVKENIDEEELGLLLYERVTEKFNILNNMIEKSGILEDYAFENDYYKLVAYMYFANLYKMPMIKEIGNKSMWEILKICFQSLSDSFVNPEFKLGGEGILEIFINEIFTDFNRSSEIALKSKEDPSAFLSVFFLKKVFKIPDKDLEDTYSEVAYDIFTLFKSTFNELSFGNLK